MKIENSKQFGTHFLKEFFKRESIVHKYRDDFYRFIYSFYINLLLSSIVVLIFQYKWSIRKE
jgi:hypothetical protein